MPLAATVVVVYLTEPPLSQPLYSGQPPFRSVEKQIPAKEKKACMTGGSSASHCFYIRGRELFEPILASRDNR